MSDRDQLAAILAERINFRDDEIADAPDAVIAAGWRPPPRVIETVEQLRQQPEETLIRWHAPNGLSWGFLEWSGGAWWQPGNDCRIDIERIPLPAQVIWERSGVRR